MAEITLILTRKPRSEFTQIGDENRDTTDLTDGARRALYGRGVTRPNGLWGTLGIIRGPQILSTRLLDMPATMLSTFVQLPEQIPLPGVIVATRYAVFAGRVLEYRTFVQAAQAEFVKEYTTAERYRADNGELGGNGYIILQPRPNMAYGLRAESGNAVVKTLRAGHSGNCLRILGTTRPKEDAILFHEAPSIGWVIGCIGPRPKGDHRVFANENGNPAQLAFDEIYKLILTTAGGRASLFVLDW